MQLNLLQQENVKTIGIDPSLCGTGVFILGKDYTYGMKIMPKKLRGAARLVYIRDGLKEVIEQQSPTFGAIEGYSYGSRGRLFELGEVGGVIKTLLYDHEISILTVTPSQLKKYATGSGNLRNKELKKRVVVAVNKLMGLDLKEKDHDVADAAILSLIAKTFISNTHPTERSKAEVIIKLLESFKG